MTQKIAVSGSFCLLLAIMILTLPLKWIIAAVLAGAFHEACHYIAIRLLGGKPGLTRLRAWNAGIPLPELSRGKELLCALAGPVGGFLLLPLLRFSPEIALCGLAQSLYNLLPVYPLDGGRALACLTALALPPTYAQWLCGFIQWLCVGALIAAGLYAVAVLKLGLAPLLLACAAAIKANCTCKDGQLALQ